MIWLHICLVLVIIICFYGMYASWPWRNTTDDIAGAIRRDLERWRVEDELARWRDIDRRIAQIRHLADYQAARRLVSEEQRQLAERLELQHPRLHSFTPRQLARKYWDRERAKVNWLKEGF